MTSIIPIKILCSTAASPTVLITEKAHELVSGQKIQITGKGYFTVTVISNVSISLQQYANPNSNVTGALNEYANTFLTEAIPAIVTPTKPLKVVTFGNSISAYGYYTTSPKSGMDARSEAAFAVHLAGPQFGWGYAGTPFTYSDKYGNYGYPAQTLTTLINDSVTNWFPQLALTGFKPDVVMGVALVENNIAAGNSYSTIVNEINAWVELMFNRFPGVILQISTPHPDARASTPALKKVFLDIRDYILSLDNSSTIFVSDLSGAGSYANPTDLTQPLPYYGWSSVEGTDIYGVHPSEAGARVNGRIYAGTLTRISGKLGASPFNVLSSNIALTGSGAVASPTGHSGTAPIGATFATVALTAGATLVSTASNPGKWNMVYTTASGLENVIARMSFTSPIPTGNMKTWAKVRVNSGAEYLKNIVQYTTIAYTAGSPANDQYVSQNAANTAIGTFGFPTTLTNYKNGDVLYLTSPTIIPSVTGNGISQVYHDVMVIPGYAGRVIDIDILETGVIDLGNDGKVGEIVNTTTASPGVSLTTNTPANVISKNLTVGWWKISGVVNYALSSATATNFTCGTSTTSATLPTQPGNQAIGSDGLVSTPLMTTLLSDTYSQILAPVLVKITVTTTVFLIGKATFSAGAVTAYGTMRAERVQVDGVNN